MAALSLQTTKCLGREPRLRSMRCCQHGQTSNPALEKGYWTEAVLELAADSSTSIPSLCARRRSARARQVAGTIGVVKVLFREIRAGDAAAVTARLDANPILVGAIAKAPPAKDDGQSTLQVAIKTGRFEVAHLLLDRGADVHFMDQSPINAWNTPVLHDAIRAAVFSSRFGVNRALPGEPASVEVMNTREHSDRAYGVLERVIALGADPSVTDSCGNPALMRAVLDSRQVLYDLALPDRDADLRRVFSLLLGAGADPEWVDERRGARAADIFADEAVREFLPR